MNILFFIKLVRLLPAFLCGVLLLPFASTTLKAQTGEIRGQFRLLSLTPIRAELYYALDGEREACHPRMNRFSEFYEFRFPEGTERVLRFYQKLPDAPVADNEEADAPRFRPMGAVNVPASGNYLIFLQPQFATEGRSRELQRLGTSLIEDDFAREGSEDWLFINTTDSAIVGRIGQEGNVVRIKAKGRQKATVRTEREFNLVQFAAQIDGEARVFYSTAWPTYANSRYMVIFGASSQNGEIGVYRITDSRR